ncbi:unnamed protein product [Didymodactylos carnosus]|uniref:DUF3456 domain-containing protein n=1 Tax=Didymodactylos carnosus TaxID=1234261 RepID=A0A813PJ20_9BILA|nr:unnamed protein product [Didymodactylos carnosus]CAF0859233.1 unnamed protein product [Didymodactylos carnosus]CAF3531090.1 unnamed protein product [Didymodactylos carnosus]CAF3644183.1 unnamed protein product [Didymodactylos carnosus]
MYSSFIILLFLSLKVILTISDDPNRLPTKCEVCKLLAQELTDNLQAHGSHEVIDTGYSLDDRSNAKNKKKYSESETRLIEVLEGVCERFLHYNVHAERKGSLRYARGRSQTMQTLWNLRNKGVKVVLDIPDNLWDVPSAEITQLKKYCEEMLEENEELIETWYFDKQKVSLNKYLCEENVLKNDDPSCLYEVFTGEEEKEDSDVQKKTKGDMGGNEKSEL